MPQLHVDLAKGSNDELYFEFPAFNSEFDMQGGMKRRRLSRFGHDEDVRVLLTSMPTLRRKRWSFIPGPADFDEWLTL